MWEAGFNAKYPEDEIVFTKRLSGCRGRTDLVIDDFKTRMLRTDQVMANLNPSQMIALRDPTNQPVGFG